MTNPWRLWWAWYPVKVQGQRVWGRWVRRQRLISPRDGDDYGWWYEKVNP